MYVIKRIDQGGGYVAPPGQHSSYTKSIEKAQKYQTKEAAEAELCPGNEIILNVRDLLSCMTRFRALS